MNAHEQAKRQAGRARKLLPDEPAQLWAEGRFHVLSSRWLVEWTATELTKLVRRQVAYVQFSTAALRLVEEGWSMPLVADMSRFFRTRMLGSFLQVCDRHHERSQSDAGQADDRPVAERRAGVATSN